MNPPATSASTRLAPTFFGRIASLASRETLSKYFGLFIVISSLLLGLVTYAVLTDDISIGDKPKGFYWLLAIDGGLLLALIYVIGWRAWGVWKTRKQQLAGSQLQIQLMGLFSALVTIPAVIVALFAITFIHFGVQAWFGDTISVAINESQEVAQSYLKEHQQSIRADMLAMAGDMNREAARLTLNDEALQEFFQTQAYLRNFSEAVMLDRSGKIIARAGFSFSLEFLPQNFSEMINRAENGEVVVFTGENEDRVRALVKLDNYVDSYLFVGRFIDENVLSRISSTDKAVSTYQALEKKQGNLKLNMTLIFIMVAVMLLLVAVWAGLTLAERIVLPVSKLIQAAERVRSGDLNARVETTNGESEIAILSRAFNRMTHQLATQRSDLITANSQLDERRRFTETVLSGVNAGILGMDNKGVIQLMNPSAEKLFDCAASETIGKKLSDICPEMEKIRRVLRGKAGRSVEVPVDVTIGTQTAESHWIVRMTAEGEGEDVHGYVAMFDDLSPLIDAQRKAAWSDVARRVAHEIKNPLTPIQLAAERLKRKYSKLITEDRETFEMCTDTIVRQVDDIRHMVDEFSAFARLPDATKHSENLVTLCQYVVVLFQQGHAGVTFKFNRPDQPITLEIDRQQITQAVTNLVKNAYESTLEAKEKSDGEYQGIVTLDLEEAPDAVFLSVTDNGAGWPEELLPRLTDPYVTTKSTGTGLGLSIVSKIVEDHKGSMEFLNNIPTGAIIRLKFPKGEEQNG
jgi:two-component system, NtrC family, nitrogen regulation sensor histidine kinase NtrY